MAPRPLEGVKILDFSQVLAAPFCGMMLADMGAEIIKVERPGNGDISREYGPYINDISLYYCQYNRGKKGLAIDMRAEEGKKLVLELVAQVDIVIENYKYGTLEKLGIGYEEMKRVNPQLIYGSIAGFGTYGPLSHLPCMDIIAAARSGLVGQTGVDVPIKPGFSICDTWAGLQLLRGLSMALLYKHTTGKGLRVDIAMLDAAFYMCEVPVLEHSLSGAFTPRTGNHDPYFAPCGEFAAKDGHVVIALTEEHQWPILCHALGLQELADDPRYYNNEARTLSRAALTEEIERVTATYGRYELEQKLLAAGIPAAAVQTIGEFVNDPAAGELDVIVKTTQENVGDYLSVNTPIRFSKTPAFPVSGAPSYPGAQSREVLTDAGYCAQAINALLASGAVVQPA
ncbi:MAG: CoA transferase [Clostridiales Family XIII bacterium]|jgi:crotonobetainyl-CoA:carnitine CoA-transferase CaiB-like acyl-CoA transferase|nr:CoA transferase [Clostridiales Family XIII bacterium]